MVVTLAQDAYAETYADSVPAIRGIAAAFATGNDKSNEFEENMAEGNYAFCCAYEDYDRDNGEFLDWVRFRVRRRLLDVRRSPARRQRNLPRVELQDHQRTCGPAGFMTDLLDELSEDAKHVVSLVLDAPPDVILALCERGRVNAVTIKAALREFLIDLGWTTSRVSKSFAEIRKALQ